MTSPPPSFRFAVLIVLGASVACLALIAGSTDIGVRAAVAALFGDAAEPARTVVLELRLPRLLSAFGIGALLALAGVLLQALFRNPLADSYVLGVSGGSALGALVALLFGASLWLVQGAAAAGAMLATLLVLTLARGGGTVRVLLTGVVIASACGALVTLVLVLADTGQLRGMMFWLAGDLGWALDARVSLAAVVIATVLAVALARPLNVLASGELRARSVGLDVDAWRTLVFVACAVLTAIAVTSAGAVGFVGLITPHAVRLLFRTSDHRVVAPASALLGGTVLAAADLVARTVASPHQLPVGAVMALVGAPLFIALLRSQTRAVH